MASPTQWLWVWVNSGSWWWTGRPGLLRFMELQRVGHNWAELNWTELNWTEVIKMYAVVVQLLSCVWLFVTPWTVVRQAPLSSTLSHSLLKFMSVMSVMLSKQLTLCHPLLLLPSVFPSIRVFSNESALHIRWPKHWSFSFNISPSSEYSGLIYFRTDWFDLLAVQGTLKCLLQHPNLKATILWHSAFFVAQFSHPYMTTGKTVALTIRTFVSKVMSLLFNTLSRFVIAFFPRSKCLLIWWLQSLSAVILEPQKIKSATTSIFSPSICHEVMGPNVMTLVLWMSHSYPVKGSINNVKRQTTKSKRPLPLM